MNCCRRTVIAIKCSYVSAAPECKGDHSETCVPRAGPPPAASPSLAEIRPTGYRLSMPMWGLCRAQRRAQDLLRWRKQRASRWIQYRSNGLAFDRTHANYPIRCVKFLQTIKKKERSARCQARIGGSGFRDDWLASPQDAAARYVTTRRRREPKEMGMFSLRGSSYALRAAIGKRLALGLLMTLFAIVSGWMLVPPELGTDQATVDWYTR